MSAYDDVTENDADILKDELTDNDDDSELTEYELDHVLIGHSDETPHLNTDEAMSFKWMSIENIKKEIELHPRLYTEWFKIILEDHYETLLALQYNESL